MTRKKPARRGASQRGAAGRVVAQEPPKRLRDLTALVGVDAFGYTVRHYPARKPAGIALDAATVARLRRKARRAVGDLPPCDTCDSDTLAIALARDLLRVLDGKPERKR